MSNRFVKFMHGSVTGILNNVLMIVFQVVLTPLLLTLSGKEALGAYAVIMQVIGYGILLDFGFTTALTRYLCRAYENRNHNDHFRGLLTIGKRYFYFSNSLLFLMLLIVSLNINVIMPGSENVKMQAQLALMFMGIWCLLRTPLYVYNYALIATQDMGTINIISIYTTLIRFLISLLLVYLGAGLIGLIVSNMLSEFAQYIMQRMFFQKKHSELSPQKMRGDRKLLTKLFRFGANYWGVNLAVVLLLGSDNIIVSTLYGASAASIFYSTKIFGSLVIQFITRIIDNSYPMLNELIAKDDLVTVRDIYLRMFKYILMVTIPSVLAIISFSGPLITLWLGQKQYAGIIMANFLSLFVFLQILNHLHGIVVLALGTIRHWSLISISSGLLSIILGFFMGKAYGLQWVLLGMSIAMLPIFIFLMSRVIMALNIKVLDILMNSLHAIYVSAPLAIVSFSYYLFTTLPTLRNLSVTILLYCLLWIGALWGWGITLKEKIQIKFILNKVLQRA